MRGKFRRKHGPKFGSVHLHTISLTVIGCLEGETMEEGWGGGGNQLIMSTVIHTVQYYTLLVRK